MLGFDEKIDYLKEVLGVVDNDNYADSFKVDISLFIGDFDTLNPKMIFLNKLSSRVEIDGWIDKLTSRIVMKFDEDNETFVEPYLPNYKIGIMHLAAGIWKNGKDMRIDRSIQIDIETLENKKVLKSLRYNN